MKNSAPYQTAILISVTLFTSSLWALPASANKFLYLDNINTLSRTVFAGGGGTDTTINGGGGTANWVLTPALAQAITIDGAGASIPVRLTLGETGPGTNRDFTITLSSNDPAVGGNFAQLVLTGQNLNPAVTATYNIPLLPAPSTADVDIDASYNIALSITNDTVASNERIIVTNAGSYVDIPSLDVINVDSVTFYDNTYAGSGVVIPGATPGDPAYVRAVISDPFGAYDITSATVAMTAGNCTISSAAMTEIVALATAATKTFESVIVDTSPLPESTCTATVTGNEGTEGTVNHTNTGDLVVGTPDLTIDKTVSGGAKPGETLTYTIEVNNIGTGYSNSVDLGDILSPYTAFGLTGPAPYTNSFTYSDGAGGCGTASGLALIAPEFADDSPPTYAYAPGAAGWDGSITAWRMLSMTGSMAPGSCFTVTYDVQIK